MEQLTARKAISLLTLIRDFILREVIPNDPQSQHEVAEIFDQIINLIDDYKQRQGG